MHFQPCILSVSLHLCLGAPAFCLLSRGTLPESTGVCVRACVRARGLTQMAALLMLTEHSQHADCRAGVIGGPRSGPYSAAKMEKLKSALSRSHVGRHEERHENARVAHIQRKYREIDVNCT